MLTLGDHENSAVRLIHSIDANVSMGQYTLPSQSVMYGIRKTVPSHKASDGMRYLLFD